MKISSDPAFPGVVEFMGVPGFFLNGKFHPVLRGGDGTDDSASEKGSEGGTGDADDKSKNQGGTDTGKKEEEDKSGKEPKFTQEQLDAIIAREKTGALRGKVDPKELGFASQKELKEFVEAMKEKADKDKTDSEKAQEKAVEDAVKTAEGAILKEANRRVLKAEFILKATRAKVHPDRVDDAFALVQNIEDLWKGVEIDDKGVVTGLDDTFFESLKEKKPFLFDEVKEGDDTTTNRDGGASAGGGGSATGDAKEKDLRDKYPALNRILG